MTNLKENNIKVGMFPQKRNGKVCYYCGALIEFIFERLGYNQGKSEEWCPKCKKKF